MCTQGRHRQVSYEGVSSDRLTRWHVTREQVYRKRGKDVLCIQLDPVSWTYERREGGREGASERGWGGERGLDLILLDAI